VTSLELKLPPLALFLICGVLAWLIARAAGSLSYTLPLAKPLAAVFFVAGAVTGLAGVAAFRRNRTTVDPVHPDRASQLVTTGIYRHTRNPMYLGLLLGLAAWSVVLGNVASLIVLPVFVLWITRFQIVPEERVMVAGFGEAYIDYAARVRRWC